MRRGEIAELLPEVYRRALGDGGPLDVLLEIMEAYQHPAARWRDRIDEILDPHRAPPEFVAYLAGWVDLDWLFREPTRRGHPVQEGSPLLTSDLGRLRLLVARASELARWRGTKRGLLRFLELATGLEGFEVVEDRGPGKEGRGSHHITVRAPPEASPWRPVIDRVIRAEKPAHLTHDLTIREPETEE